MIKFLIKFSTNLFSPKVKMPKLRINTGVSTSSLSSKKQRKGDPNLE